MIPKKIHYFWFSDNPYPSSIKYCMDSWKKYLPDYEILLWNTKNFDVHMNAWCSEAYDAKKYAFVSDFARFYVLYHYGGIYLDSDVEIVKNLDSLLTNSAFAGFMTKSEIIEAEIIGSESGNPIMKKMMDYYEGLHFLQSDNTQDEKELPRIFFDIVSMEEKITTSKEYNLPSLHLYPIGFFTYIYDVLSIPNPFANMYSFHYGSGIGWRKSISIIKKHIIYYHIKYTLRILRIVDKLHLLNFVRYLWLLYIKHIK